MIGLTRLFSEIGESYMNLIVSEQEMNQSQIVQAVLACTTYEDTSGSDDVPKMTLRFWRYDQKFYLIFFFLFSSSICIFNHVMY